MCGPIGSTMVSVVCLRVRRGAVGGRSGEAASSPAGGLPWRERSLGRARVRATEGGVPTTRYLKDRERSFSAMLRQAPTHSVLASLVLSDQPTSGSGPF